MSARFTSGDPGIGRLVEKQMRNWELARAQRPSEGVERPRHVEEFICISRQVGVPAARVARGLGERLGWPVFDRQILESMGGDDQIRKQIYTSMDQRDLGWWEETLRALMQSEFVRNDYFHRLCETLLSLARQSACVFLGRGADLILPRDRGLRVRLVAPVEKRVAWYAEERGLEPAVARAEVARVDAERSAFIRRHFGVEADDPLRHDLVLNLERLEPERVTELVLSARDRGRSG